MATYPKDPYVSESFADLLKVLESDKRDGLVNVVIADMELHARNVAVSAGAKGTEIDRVAEMMVKERKIRADVAAEMLKLVRGKD